MIAIRMMALGRKLGNLYAGLCAPICRQYGMNQTCFDVLMFCANNPDRNTARDVCEVRGIKSGMASVAVETLEKSGLLERREDPEDRRKHRLMPTERAAGHPRGESVLTGETSGLCPEPCLGNFLKEVS